MKPRSGECFAKYHEEQARYGGASREFHELASSYLRTVADERDAALARAEAAEASASAWHTRCEAERQAHEASELAVRAVEAERDRALEEVRAVNLGALDMRREVKRLREALAEVERQADMAAAKERLLRKVEAERAEALACRDAALTDAARVRDDYDALAKERDEAKAEVERLRVLIHDLLYHPHQHCTAGCEVGIDGDCPVTRARAEEKK